MIANDTTRQIDLLYDGGIHVIASPKMSCAPLTIQRVKDVFSFEGDSNCYNGPVLNHRTDWQLLNQTHLIYNYNHPLNMYTY